MCDLGTTTTQRTAQDFSPAQIAAQRIGLGTIALTQPQQAAEMLRSLGLLQPAGAGGMPSAYSTIRAPIHAASGMARNAFGTALAQRGVPNNVSFPMVDAMGNIDVEAMNAARSFLDDRFLRGSPFQMYRPDLGPFIAAPKSTQTITDSEEGTGASVLKALGSIAGAYFGSLGPSSTK